MSDHDQDEPEVGEDDEFEMRMEEMREPVGNAGAASPDAAPGSPQGDRFRAARLAVYVLALAAVVVFGLAPGGGLSRMSSSLQIAFSGFGSAYPTPTLVQGTPPELGPPPKSCTPAAQWPSLVTKVSGQFGGALGASPVWAVGFDGSESTAHVVLGYSRYGWKARINFYVEPGFTDHVVVRGERLPDGSPIWIGVDDPEHNLSAAKPSVAITLDPKTPGLPDYWNTSVGGVSEYWATWYATLYLPAAGCYALEASWPGGSWRVTFTGGDL